MFRQSLEYRRQPVQPVRERLITGQLWEPFQQMVFGVFVYRLLLKSPLADAPQVNCNAILIAELGTEIVALTLHFCFYYVTIVTDSAVELDEFCLPHSFILSSFALFFYPFFTLDSHYQF